MSGRAAATFLLLAVWSGQFVGRLVVVVVVVVVVGVVLVRRYYDCGCGGHSLG